ncbi:MAG: hypothetical protein ACKV2T_38040 [Kofleriaceae bacterium]
MAVCACGDDGGSVGDDDPGPGSDAAPDTMGADGGTDPQSTTCAALPVTVTLGPSIAAGTTGAVVCLEGTNCRLTTNVYSDGTNPCAETNVAVRFFNMGTSNRIFPPGTWTLVSSSSGTFNAQGISDIPSSTSTTAVLNRTSDNAQYTAVFTFNGGANFTLTSFAQ